MFASHTITYLQLYTPESAPDPPCPSLPLAANLTYFSKHYLTPTDYVSSPMATKLSFDLFRYL